MVWYVVVQQCGVMMESKRKVLRMDNTPVSTYRFHIAAVYTNNDNLMGPTSRRFLLEEDSNTQRPVEPPSITSLQPESPTMVRMKWSYNPTPGTPVEGFFIHYREATVAGDYTKVGTAVGQGCKDL